MSKLYRFSLYTIFNVFSIRWTLLYQQIYPTDFQSLNLGSCLMNGGDLFCQKYRRHSYCSTQQDECFCLPGYVSVYEMNDSWYTCRPLLTDLYCRMDSDCSYIHGSICHPGVGACVCPSGYEFTFQKFSCFPRVNDTSIRPYCVACQKIGGVCVWNDRKGELLLDNDNQDNIQCACPRRSNISIIKKYTFSDICNSFPADIGEECNPVNKVCLSQKAICQRGSADELQDFTSTQLTIYPNVNICICHEGMIPVYQKNLDYFECFVERTDPTIIDCQNCLKSHGKCYQYNIGSIQNEYGCLCPLFKQNTMNTTDEYQCFKDTCSQHLDMNSNIKLNNDLRRIHNKSDQYKQKKLSSKFSTNNMDCIDDFIQIQCNLVSINFTFTYPYQTSMLKHNYMSNNFVVYLQTSSIIPKLISNELNHSILHKLPIQKCYLNQMNTFNNEYNSIFNLKLNEFKQCGIYEINYKHGSVFYGTLHAENVKKEISLLRKFHIDFVCHTKESHPNRSTSYFYDRSTLFKRRTNQLALIQKPPGNDKYFSTEYVRKKTDESQITQHQSITLSIIDLNKHIPQNIQMKLKVTSTLSGRKCDRLIKLCFNTNIHRIKQMINVFNSLPSYQCIVFQHSLQNQIQRNNQSTWISQLFNLQSITSLINSVYFTCLIRVCQMEQFCTYASFYTSNETNEHYKNYSIQSKVSVPLILLNNQIETKLFQLFPPINLYKLIQFYFIESTIELTNQTITEKQSNNPIDVYFRYANTEINNSKDYGWINYVLGISTLVLICQIMIISLPYLQKFYVKYKHGDYTNPFVIAMSTNKLQRCLTRNINSDHKNHNDNIIEDVDEIHNIHIMNDKQDSELNKEITNIECCTIEQNSCHQYPQYKHGNYLNITSKPQQTRQSMTYLLLHPFNKLNSHPLFNGNNTISYTNSCLSSSIRPQHNSLSHFTTGSYVKSHKFNLSQCTDEAELHGEHNQMKTPIEQSTQKVYDENVQINNVNNHLTNKSKQGNMFLSICYHDDCLKQHYGDCTVYHNLKNQDYKDGWV
ncbi:hypothetical protein MN116_005664 [Schistosoma mekongi]|uniref:Uncharacterized protein n=1 Tax=Schistosoma mekongi TaxID=38744 RepID=A0AAE1ZBR2_SCHME|nr:hypothetical protein MN116_005664 [Schistosoma mekongi]